MAGVNIDELLGPSQSRYFSHGYRTSLAEIRDISCVSESTGTQVLATGSVVYPSNGLGDQSKVLHLSTLDATVLMLRTLEATGASPHYFDSFWVKSIALNAGTQPWEVLEHIPVDISITASDADSNFCVSGRIGNIRSSINLEKLPSSAENIFSDQRKYSAYGDAYKYFSEQIHVDYAETESALFGELEYRLINHIPKEIVYGVESDIWPTPTMLELITAMGQLTQATICRAEAIKRSEIENLWMRSMQISRNEQPRTGTFQMGTKTQIVSNKVIQVNGKEYKTMKIASTSSLGHVASASVAYAHKPGA